MNIFGKIFGRNSGNISIKQEVMINVSSINIDKIPSNAEIISESEIPEYCSIANLIFEKKFHEAIELGQKLLEKTPNSAGVHVNLMNAYFKLRNENAHFLEKTITHGKLAMLYGHNTGYVQERLVINLEKLKKFNQAIQICDIVLLDNFYFSTHGCGNKDDFTKRKNKLLQKLDRTKDNQYNKLFTNEEILFVIEQIRLESERIKTERIEYEQRMKQFEMELSKIF